MQGVLDIAKCLTIDEVNYTGKCPISKAGMNGLRVIVECLAPLTRVYVS